MEPRNSTSGIEEESNNPKFAGHDIFQDPALAATLKDDPLFNFLKRSWTQILVVGLAIVLGVYAKGAFDDTYRAEMGRAADGFITLQQQYDALSGLQAALERASDEESKAKDEKKADASKKVSDARQALKQGQERAQSLIATLMDSKEPYASLARLYSGLLQLNFADSKANGSALSYDNWKSINDKNSNVRFYSELEALAAARAGLDQDTTYAQARRTLIELAQNGAFADVMAALSLAKSSRTPAERAEARPIIEGLMSRAPEQSAVLEPFLSQLRA